jgi:hypothetical protein
VSCSLTHVCAECAHGNADDVVADTIRITGTNYSANADSDTCDNADACADGSTVAS